MKNLFFVLLLFSINHTFLFAQDNEPVPETTLVNDVPSSVNPATFAKTITSQGLEAHLSILASDDFEGRETGTEGNEKAANYIAGEFEKMGIPPLENGSYFQKVAFNWSQWEDISMNINGNRFRHLWEFISFPTRNNDLPAIQTDEIIFLGYGIDDPKYSDYSGVDVATAFQIVAAGIGYWSDTILSKPSWRNTR